MLCCSWPASQKWAILYLPASSLPKLPQADSGRDTGYWLLYTPAPLKEDSIYYQNQQTDNLRFELPSLDKDVFFQAWALDIFSK